MASFKDTIFKTSNKKVWSNDFWYVKAYTLWKFIQYNIYWDKTDWDKFPSDKINGTKMHAFFSRVPTHQNFTFNSPFLY